ncbi:MAG: mannose-1-phosphate guanylyltransferase [Candidatus Ancaeobacter aquaticus]|nr:mannose-1-phosphate guanylyltransferase [Candidatus Ancaeobacter aquaticus]
MKIQKDLYTVIMAGGSGERFWPMSRQDTPKQLLPLTSTKTLLQETIERVSRFTSVENIIIVTNEKHVKATIKQVPYIKKSNIIAEPVGRNTAPCIALAATIIAKRNPNAVMVVLPADHIIKDNNLFKRTIIDSAKMCDKNNVLVTIGIVPRTPHTGYGYIKTGKKMRYDSKSVFHHVDRFEEKPTSLKAKKFVASDKYLWNSGMFVWKVSTILSAINEYLPSLSKDISALNNYIGKKCFSSKVKDVYHRLEKISIDYGIMEKSQNIIVTKGVFYWDDIGSWESYNKYLSHDRHNNAQKGEVILEDVHNSLIVSDDGVIAVSGVKNLIIVKTRDALLICDRSKSEEIKKLVEQLKNHKKYTQYI